MQITTVFFAHTGDHTIDGKAIESLVPFQIERLRQARIPDNVMIATPDGEFSLPATEGLANLKVFRGNPDNWAECILNAAINSGADAIVRIMADQVFMDWRIVDSVASVFLDSGANYVSSESDSVDAVKVSTLQEALDTQAGSNPQDVWTSLSKTNPYGQSVYVPSLRPKVDLTAIDEASQKKIYESFMDLYTANKNFSIADALHHFQARRSKSRENSDVETGRKKNKRDRSRIQREYNQDKWPIYDGIIDELARDGETALARIYRLTIDKARNYPGSEPRDVIINRRKVTLPGAFALGGIEALVAAELNEACPDDVSAIIEIGSGVGRNLISYWLHGGPRDVPYVAYEITEAGRRATEKFSLAEEGFDLRTCHFDLNAPDFSTLPPGNGPVLLFTNHAIEQVPYLKPDLYIALSDLDRPVTGIHFEPIGWQIQHFRGHLENPGSSSAYAEQHDYNRNLWNVLRDAESQGRITIEDVRPDVACINQHNGTSIVKWRIAARPVNDV